MRAEVRGARARAAVGTFPFAALEPFEKLANARGSVQSHRHPAREDAMSKYTPLQRSPRRSPPRPCARRARPSSGARSLPLRTPPSRSSRGSPSSVTTRRACRRRGPTPARRRARAPPRGSAPTRSGRGRSAVVVDRRSGRGREPRRRRADQRSSVGGPAAPWPGLRPRAPRARLRGGHVAAGRSPSAERWSGRSARACPACNPRRPGRRHGGPRRPRRGSNSLVAFASENPSKEVVAHG